MSFIKSPKAAAVIFNQCLDVIISESSVNSEQWSLVNKLNLVSMDAMLLKKTDGRLVYQFFDSI